MTVKKVSRSFLIFFIIIVSSFCILNLFLGENIFLTNLKEENIDNDKIESNLGLDWCYPSSAADIAISADGEYIVAAIGTKIVLFNNTSTTPIWENNTGTGVFSVDISSDGSYIVAGGQDQYVYLFSRASPNPIWRLKVNYTINDIEISNDGNYFIAGLDNNGLYLFERESKTIIWRNNTIGSVYKLDISNNGYYITAHVGEDMYVFNRLSAEPLWCADGESYGISFAISGDGNYIIFSRFKYPTANVSLYSTSSPTPIWSTLIGSEQAYVDISDDGNEIVVRNNTEIILYYKGSSMPVRKFYLSTWVMVFSISADGNYLAVGTNNDKIYYYEVSNSDYLWDYDLSGNNIDGVVISSNGLYILSNYNNAVCLLKNGELPIIIDLSSDASNPDTDGAHTLSWVASTSANYYNIYVHNSYISDINDTVELKYTQLEGKEQLVEEFIDGTYYYVVVGFYDNGNESSNCVSTIVDLTPYTGSMNLTSDADDPDEDGKFMLDWVGIYNTTNFTIYKDTENITAIHGGLDIIKEGLKNTFFQVSTTLSGKYYYAIVAHLLNGSLILSNCINITNEINVNGTYYVNPLIVDDIGGGNSTWNQLTSNNWCSGSGSYGDSYIISDINIDGGGSGSCLEIRHSEVYFVITNSTFLNSGSGVFDSGLLLENVTRGTVIENNCSFNNGHGITFIDSYNNTIEDNILMYNSYSGIYIDPSYNMTVTLNYANNNDQYGIYIESNENISITQNFASGNELYGIYLENATEIDVVRNIISNNRGYGIFLNNSDENNLRENIISNNLVGVYFDNSNNNIILDNTLTGNTEDFIEVDSQGNDFGDEETDPTPLIEDPPNILLLLIIIGALSAALGGGGFVVVKSRKTLRERDEEILALMSKKESITEEDIAISKERHFCVVHRGPIEGYNFICPDCGTYYCIKCIEAIKKLENSCWSCGVPLDPSMPIKEVKKKEDDMEAIVEDGSEIEASEVESPKGPKIPKAPKNDFKKIPK